MRPEPHSPRAGLTDLTLCGFIATACSRAGNHEETTSTRDLATQPPSRGGIDPQAPIGRFEPAGSQSETGPNPEAIGSGKGRLLVPGRETEMANRDSKIRGQRWRLLVGSVALGAAA